MRRIAQFLCPNLSELASRVRDSCDRGDWSGTKSRKVLVCSPQTGIRHTVQLDELLNGCLHLESILL